MHRYNKIIYIICTDINHTAGHRLNAPTPPPRAIQETLGRHSGHTDPRVPGTPTIRETLRRHSGGTRRAIDPESQRH